MAQDSPVNKLVAWFNDLDEGDQEDVVRFLYAGGGKLLLNEGRFFGPNPNIVQKGLHCGPLPSQMSGRVCPSCGRPL